MGKQYKRRKFQVPLDTDGNLVRNAHPPHSPFTRPDLTWADGLQRWADSLRVIGWRKAEHGRGVGYFSLVSMVTGKEYTMNPPDLSAVMESGRVHDGLMTGTWEYVKCNSTYSVRMRP